MIKNDFLKMNGYVVFNLKDYDAELYDKFVKHSYINSLDELSTEFYEFRISCKSLLSPEELISKFSKIEFKDVITGINITNFTESNHGGYSYDLTFEFSPQYEYIQEIYNYCKILQNMLFYDIYQSWFQVVRGEIEDEKDIKIKNRLKFLEELNKKIISDFYDDDVNPYFENGNFIVQQTYFPKGTGIIEHEDGLNPTRLCAILYYLSNDWRYGDGGELVIKKGEVVVPPITGNVVLLDFSENNVSHAVNEVINEFGRYTYLSFFEIRNSVSHKEDKSII